MSACASRNAVVRSDLSPTESAPAVVRLENVPFFPDDTDQCGPSVLASVLQFWGKDVSPEQLKSEVYVQRLRGSLPMDMAPALQAHGLATHLIAGSFEDVKSALRAGRPLIAYLDFGTRAHPIGHYVVITGYDDRRRGLYIHSAKNKDKFASYRRFNRGWSDTDHWLLLAEPGVATDVVLSTLTASTAVSASGFNGRAPRFHASLTAKEYVELGAIYASQGKIDDANAQYKLALSVDKRFVPAWIGLGNNAFETKQYREAEKYFERALKINPDDPTANNNLAMSYVAQRRRLDRAQELATKALSSNLRPYATDTLTQIALLRADKTNER